MQRLFSSFPDGGPGAGLLILRCALAVAVFDGAGGVAVAPLLVAGFMTPAASIAAGVLAVLMDAPVLAAIALALALLGPGAYSVDARLFGRREIVIDG